MHTLTCFKAYDVRGRIPDELNEDIAYRIGCAYAQFLNPNQVVVGYDIRLTSFDISRALIRGLTQGGVNVLDIGQCGTEEVYFATSHLKADGGICVTASHNPKDYNGMKFVREESKPISGDTGLKEIQRLAEVNNFKAPDTEDKGKGSVTKVEVQPAYIKHLLTYVDVKKLKPLKIVCNAGNGGAGDVIDAIESVLPFQWTKVHHQADGNFPNGVPNPLLEENRPVTIAAIKNTDADIGIAWDGDFDRCFFFDETGNFIEGYYIVGLLAEAFLKKQPGGKIIHDPRLTWNTIDIAKTYGGEAIESKTGHAFIKERMRLEDAVYGGEMSAHHYFKDFAYCDSGMIPWLLVAELISTTGKPLSSLVEARMKAYPCSGEINIRLNNPKAVIAGITTQYTQDAKAVNTTDGISIEYETWRFNLRSSNTEPVVRLNIESKADVPLMQDKTQEILSLIKKLDAAS